MELRGAYAGLAAEVTELSVKGKCKATCPTHRKAAAKGVEIVSVFPFSMVSLTTCDVVIYSTMLLLQKTN